MHSIILAALYVVALPGTFAPIQAVASPVPVPMPLPLMATDYSYNNITAARASTIKNIKTKHSFDPNHTPMASSPVHTRDVVDGFDLLTAFYTRANNHATNLKGLAARSASVEDDDYDFQHSCVYELTGFQTNLLGFQSKLGADKSDYRGSEFQILLKNIIDANKDALRATDVLVYNLPILGPLLGPIVYEIKCILDEVLNFCETLTDGIADVLLSLLRLVILKASVTCLL